MQFIVTTGQRLTAGSQRVLGKALAIGVLLAVPTLGLARLSTDLLAFWHNPGASEAVLVGNSTEGLLAFDAPASTLRQYQLRVNDSVSAKGQADRSIQTSLLATDWRNTAQPLDITPTINSYMSTLARTQFISDAWLLSAGMPPDVLGLVMVQQTALNQIVTQDLFTISQTVPLNVPMINGFLGNIVMNEFIFDNWLISAGVSPSVMALLLGSQIGFNEVVSQFFLSVIPPTPLQPASPSS